MPELPEVEIMTRNLATWAHGRRILGLRLTDPRLDKGGLADWWERRASGRPRVLHLHRRAKYTVVQVGEDGVQEVILLHYRMTGRVVAEAPDQRKGQRLVFAFEPEVGRPDHVIFDDPRRLGTAEVLSPEAFDLWRQPSKRMGPEPWPMPRDAGFWRSRLGSARGAVKPALMDQARVAGLGNIAASEILWRAGIDPRAGAHTLSDAQWARLSQAVPAFIQDTLDRESGDEIAYVNSGGGSQRGIPSPFDVYRCEGQPCPRCAAPIAAFRQSGRSTFWCASCQGGT